MDLFEKAEYLEEILNDEDKWEDTDEFNNFVKSEAHNLIKKVKENKSDLMWIIEGLFDSLEEEDKSNRYYKMIDLDRYNYWKMEFKYIMKKESEKK